MSWIMGGVFGLLATLCFLAAGLCVNQDDKSKGWFRFYAAMACMNGLNAVLCELHVIAEAVGASR